VWRHGEDQDADGEQSDRAGGEREDARRWCRRLGADDRTLFSREFGRMSPCSLVRWERTSLHNCEIVVKAQHQRTSRAWTHGYDASVRPPAVGDDWLGLTAAQLPIGSIYDWCVHRVGRLELGESSVVAAVSAPHRPEAFAAARFAIDALKVSVPVWKREVWSDGSDWGTNAAELVDAGDVVSPDVGSDAMGAG
jgi:hypothetical protein